MATTITCPMCLADVALTPGAAVSLCPDCHGMSDDELAAELQKRVERAVWTALRAVEDQAAYARWAAENGKAVPRGAGASQEAAQLLRTVLSRRAEEGAPVEQG